MGPTLAQLEEALNQGDAKACAVLFTGATEKDRQALAEFAYRRRTELSANSYLETTPGTFTRNQLLDAAEVAVLATCSFSQLKKLGVRAVPEEKIAHQVLADRRPAWLSDWARMLLEDNPRYFRLIRMLEREDLCVHPEIDNFWLGMLDTHGALGRFTSVREGLLADPGLLDEVWRLFEIEGNGEFSLAARDKYSRPEGKWETALVQLSDEGRLPRARLLDSSLDALARDFAQFRASWFSRFHEALQPTVAERVERADRYLQLLSSKIPPTVSFALKALKILDKAARLPAGAVVAHIGPALFARQKGTVLEALRLLDRAAQREPDRKVRVTHGAAEAIRHESAQVQEAVLDLIQKHGVPNDAKLAQLLGPCASELSASLRPRLQAWLETSEGVPARETAEVQSTDVRALLQRARKLDRNIAKLAGVDDALAAVDEARCTLPSLDFDPMAIPRLDSDRRIKPIEDLDELIDVFAHVLEEQGDPMEVERVLDGVSRLCDQRPEDFAARTGPLRKRALDHLAKGAGPFVGCGVLADLCGVARAWLSGEVILPVMDRVHQYDETLHEYHYDSARTQTGFFRYHLPTARTFLSRRAFAVARRAAIGDAAPLLAAPTHAGGWIDPRELVKRALLLASLRREGDSVDQIQALLRLAPDHRDTALKAAQKICGEFGQTVRYALGGDEPIGDHSSLWVAAARARNPCRDDEEVENKHPGLGPDAGQAARYQASVRKRAQTKYHTLRVQVEPPPPAQWELERVTVLLNPQPRKPDEYHHVETRESTADLRWMLTVWPMQLESWFARALPRFADNLDWWEAQWANRTLLDPLLDPDVPLKPMALLMLALGLAAKEPGESGLATDALIAAIDDGRLDAHKLGATLAFLAPMIKNTRLVRTLGQAARISPLHVHGIAQVIQGVLRGDPASAPRDLQALLELLKESLTEMGEAVTDAEARGYLEKIEASGKTARLVRELLALEEKPAALIRSQALLRALEHRIGRAESWERRLE